MEADAGRTVDPGAHQAGAAAVRLATAVPVVDFSGGGGSSGSGGASGSW